MKHKENHLYHYAITDQGNTIPDISEIVEQYYDLGDVIQVKKLDIGDTNFNYIITVKKDNAETKYFGQLFSASTSLSSVKYELALRRYFVSNSDLMNCATACPAKDGNYMIQCICTENNRDRYFCISNFLEGRIKKREEWAGGRMSEALLKGCAKGIARFHTGAYGFIPPKDCEDIVSDYAQELAAYKSMFTEGFEKCRQGSSYAYYDYFAEYQPRLLEILERYTQKYLSVKDDLPVCVCHMDTSPQNYFFDDDLQPVAICDLNGSQERPRLYDLCWFINEGLCKFDADKMINSLDIDDIVTFLNAYDQAIEETGNPKPGRLTKKEREMVMEIFQLVSIKCGFAFIWEYILTDNPTNTYEFNTYWGNWTKTAVEFVEEHMEAFKNKITAL
ncbi:MAG: phosphotransferase [Firmicutes bacterium]|nr:phosphotransferase [Bacillota bacterium]